MIHSPLASIRLVVFHHVWCFSFFISFLLVSISTFLLFFFSFFSFGLRWSSNSFVVAGLCLANHSIRRLLNNKTLFSPAYDHVHTKEEYWLVPIKHKANKECIWILFEGFITVNLTPNNNKKKGGTLQKLHRRFFFFSRPIGISFLLSPDAQHNRAKWYTFH